MTTDPLQAAYDAACAYPHTNPDMFEESALIRIDSGEIIMNEALKRTLIENSPLSKRLTGTSLDLPTYNIHLNDSETRTLSDRIAILGFGANCSAAVLLKKFKKAGVGGDCFLTQATLENHAIVHSAFVSAAGSIPATVIPADGIHAHITVGFYTLEQAEALTATEPNYDLVQKSGLILTRGIENNPVLNNGALMYVSIWGAFTEDGQTPSLQAGIPQTSPLMATPTSWAIARAARITGYGDDTVKFVNAIKSGPENLYERLRHTFQMHPQNALTASISGTKVKDAVLYGQTRDMAVPMLPRITYL